MVEEVRTMKLEVSPLQLAEWLIHGIAVVIALLQVDSVNDRTLRPIPRARCIWERIGNIQDLLCNFFIQSAAQIGRSIMDRSKVACELPVITPKRLCLP